MHRESGVVPRVDEFGPVLLFGKKLPVAGRADAHPELTQSRQVDGFFQALANVTGGEAFPDYVRDIGGAVIKHVYTNPGIVRASEERVAGAETGADNAKAGIPLGLKPVETGARVDHGLARCVDGATNIRGDSVVGAREPGGRARVVIRKTETQDRDAKALQTAAQRVVLRQLRIPMRKQNNGLPALAPSRKPKSAYGVVFRVRCRDRRGKTEPLAIEFEVGGRLVPEEFFAAFDDGVVKTDQIIHRRDRRRILQPSGCPFTTELKGADYAIVRAKAEVVLPPINPVPVTMRNGS